MGETKIEWAERGWSPVLGCTMASAGCRNCYAVRSVWRMAHNPNPKISGPCQGLTTDRSGEMLLHQPHWTGEVRCLPDRLGEPEHWRKPARIFVCPMADLFHEKVPGTFINLVWNRMYNLPRHHWLVLTKRPERLLEWTKRKAAATGWPIDEVWPEWIWLGTSVEDQQRANQRIPILLSVPAKHRWVSAEPLLGPLELKPWLGKGKVEWVVAGCESGKNARPDSIEWYSDLWSQCISSDPDREVPYFLKQMRVEGKLVKMPELSGCVLDEYPAELR